MCLCKIQLSNCTYVVKTVKSNCTNTHYQFLFFSFYFILHVLPFSATAFTAAFTLVGCVIVVLLCRIVIC